MPQTDLEEGIANAVVVVVVVVVVVAVVVDDRNVSLQVFWGEQTVNLLLLLLFWRCVLESEEKNLLAVTVGWCPTSQGIPLRDSNDDWLSAMKIIDR